MNIKKFLQEMSERSAVVFLDEDDEQFIQQLVQAYQISDINEKENLRECDDKLNSKD